MFIEKAKRLSALNKTLTILYDDNTLLNLRILQILEQPVNTDNIKVTYMVKIKQKTRKKQDQLLKLLCMCVQELSEYNFQFKKNG